MSDILVRLARLNSGKKKDRGGEEANEHERAALAKLQEEAKLRGATLEHEGKGGLPASLALGVFRRDKYRCKRCAKRERITLHHKGDLENPPSKWLKKKGTKNDFNNIVTVCASCHDAVHNADRDAGK